jgi:hypothetical protein
MLFPELDELIEGTLSVCFILNNPAQSCISLKARVLVCSVSKHQ